MPIGHLKTSFVDFIDVFLVEFAGRIYRLADSEKNQFNQIDSFNPLFSTKPYTADCLAWKKI